jgi:VIT1/CCC1 family predicted Fe2+/Mn2+ transporter
MGANDGVVSTASLLVGVAATGPEGPGGVVVRPLGERVVRFPRLVLGDGQTAVFRVGPG